MNVPASVKVDVSDYESGLGWRNKLARVAWGVVWRLLFRPTPAICFGWRNFLLRLFGAHIGHGVHVYPSCRIWAPWNLTMADHSCLSDFVDCYCVAGIDIGAQAVVSQYSYLCTASHRIDDPHFRLVTAPIHIGPRAWVCADVFVGPGVTVGEGAVAGACAVVVKDVTPWTVVAGNPAQMIKRRIIAIE